ncbi:hypothetical protein A1O1_03755 [Capronia coronata CBS 617.96]|uniref:SHSP domain-containing protein n=1 Tax=Capronia coronata CBS 617.96 TaxID=1182541 RepID=W9YN35_9EURO|nr:uncharacterized protein A1O1_03755 [Capronia coronata CBS 617.96]EXJ90651.1 hypothetical protein A1O1_03755 [Capronia coronata CBS 617.96]
MAFLYSYPEVEPYPTTYVTHTYPEKGQHLHHIPLPFLAHKAAHRLLHDREHEVHIPKADLRETMSNFYIEVELPGISDKSQLHLRWTSMRTLLVTSKIGRPDIPESELFDVPVVAAAPEPPKEDADQQQQQEPLATSTETGVTATATTMKKEPHLTVHERLIGEMMRAFNFPVDVDRDNTHAKLEAGLLRIVVPKLKHDHAEPLHVNVKD